MMNSSRRVVLARHCSGLPEPEDFRVEDDPQRAVAEGEVAVRNFLVSVDPGTRTRLSGGASYAPPIPLGEVIEAATLGEVAESKHERFAVGDIVMGRMGWRERGVVPARALHKLTAWPLPYSTAIGILGIPGMTAYFGILKYGAAQPGETIVISSAAGSVGSAALQIAKIRGCRVVGIAGGPAKCEYVVKELGSDAAIDYKAQPDLNAAVARACPEGIDVYLDNVGNAFIDAIIPLMKPKGRIVISGQVAEYNAAAGAGPGITNTLRFITHRLRMEGFVVFDDVKEFPRAQAEMIEWIRSGRLTYREEFMDGIEAIPRAFAGLFRSENFGRRLVRLGPEPKSAITE